jgi:LPS export ABC transporter permease LptG
MRVPGLRLIDRYLLVELASPFAFGVGLLTFFLVIDRIYHLTDLVITKGVPLSLVVQLLAFMLPAFFAHTLPMALLVGVLLAGGRLAGDLEIVALKAAGVSLLRLFRPIAAAAVLVAAVVASLTLYVNPLADRAFQGQLFKILQSRAVTGLKERVFNTTFGDVMIYVEDVSASQGSLRGLLVSDERDPKLSRIITAAEGRLLSDETNQRVTLRMLNGAVNEADVMPATPPEAEATTGLPPGGAAANTRYRYTSFSLYDMNLAIDSPLKTAARTEKPEKDFTLPELRREIAHAPDPRTRLAYEVEWQKRWALPLAAIVFALVGFPLAARSHRGGRSIALLGSLVILVSYYLVMTSLEGLTLSGRLPVWLGIWLPDLLFAAIGGFLLVANTREWRWPAWPRLWAALARVEPFVPRPRALPVRVVAPLGTTARDSSHIIDRYLVREHLAFMAIGLGVAAALSVMVDLLQTMDRYLRVKPPLVYILEHFVYRLPADLHSGLPIVVLVATIFLFIALNRHQELTALKAAGLSVYRVSAPVLVLGLGVAVGAGLFQELLLPTLNERGEEIDRVKIRGQLPRHLQSRSRLWLRSSDTRFYRVELLAPGTNDLYGVTLLEIAKGFRLVDRLDARRAHWTPRGWELEDGAFRDVAPDGKVQTIPFVRSALELSEEIEDFTHIQKPVSAMSYRELAEYVARLRAAGFQVKKYLVELYSKVSFPLVNLIMVLVAIPFAVQSPRSGRLFGVGLAIIIMAAYMVIHYVALSFARADLLPPILAAWTANIIFAGVGLSLFARVRT